VCFYLRLFFLIQLLSQSVKLQDGNTFVPTTSSDAKQDFSFENGAAMKGGVKFSSGRDAKELVSLREQLGVKQKGNHRSNLKASQSPSRVMQALSKDLMSDFRLNHIEETPESLNRRGQPGVTRMKHGAPVHPTKPHKIRVNQDAIPAACLAPDDASPRIGAFAKLNFASGSKGGGLEESGSDSSSISSGSTCTRRSPRPTGRKSSQRSSFSPRGSRPPAVSGTLVRPPTPPQSQVVGGGAFEEKQHMLMLQSWVAQEKFRDEGAYAAVTMSEVFLSCCHDELRRPLPLISSDQLKTETGVYSTHNKKIGKHLMKVMGGECAKMRC
jgi:hypothetical protein